MTTPNTSATGGYLVPLPQGLYPGSLTFLQFMNQVFVGLSGLQGQFVRPKWQQSPPTQPDIDVDWMAFGVESISTPGFAFVGQNTDGSNSSNRQEDVAIQCHFYGPNAETIASQVRDGFQVQQNLDGLRAADMGFVSTGDMNHLPDLINERWFNRFIMSVYLRRQVNRTYPILTFLSTAGVIETQVGPTPENKTIPFSVVPPEE
jgi:hypothetical protein